MDCLADKHGPAMKPFPLRISAEEISPNTPTCDSVDYIKKWESPLLTVDLCQD